MKISSTDIRHPRKENILIYKFCIHFSIYATLNNLEKNNLRIGIMFQMSISSKWPHIQFCSTHLDVLFSYQRHFCRSATMKTRRGAGAHEGKMTKDEINKMIENEKRGIFRKLDIGLPQPFNKERKKINDRIIVKAAPR